jgi:hypothetical protein
VPAEAVPPGGRDVQCSVCGHTWLARPEDEEAGPAARGAASDPGARRPLPGPGGPGAADDEAEAREAGAAPAARGQRSSLTPEVAGILREEAAREAAAREAARAVPAGRPAAPPEPGSPEPGVPEARRAEEARRRMARLRDAASPTVAQAAAAPPSRRDRLPDIEAVSSGLRPSDDRAAAPERARGFRLGLALVLGLAAALALAYAYKPALVTAWPASAAVLTPYEDAVNEGRWWLDGRLRALLDAVGGPGTDAAGPGAAGVPAS